MKGFTDGHRLEPTLELPALNGELVWGGEVCQWLKGTKELNIFYEDITLLFSILVCFFYQENFNNKFKSLDFIITSTLVVNAAGATSTFPSRQCSRCHLEGQMEVAPAALSRDCSRCHFQTHITADTQGSELFRHICGGGFNRMVV